MTLLRSFLLACAYDGVCKVQRGRAAGGACQALAAAPPRNKIAVGPAPENNIHASLGQDCLGVAAEELALNIVCARRWCADDGGVQRGRAAGGACRALAAAPPEREFFIDNPLVRIHVILRTILVDRPCAMGV